MENNAKNKEEKLGNDLGKYMGMAFQMLAIIAIFTFIGYKLDAHYQNKQHVFTAALSLVGVLLALFQVIRLARKKD